MRHALRFIFFTLLILGSVFALTGLAPEVKKENAFSNIPPDQILSTKRITERRLAEIKISHLLSNPPPQVGLFGNHLVRHMGGDALGAGLNPNVFFNFYVPHFSLDQIRDTLLIAEQHTALPCELIMVGISNPIVELRETLGYAYSNLPDWVFLSRHVISERPFGERIRRSAVALIREIEERTAWRNAAFGLSRMLDDTALLEFLRHIGLARILIERWQLQPSYIYVPAAEGRVGLRADGMRFEKRPPEEVDREFDTARANVRADAPRARKFQFGSAAKIAAVMHEINRVAKRNGRTAVFFAMPALDPYEPGDPDQKELTTAFELTADLTVFDDRWRFRTRPYFESSYHLGEQYFSELMARINQKLNMNFSRRDGCGP